MRRGSDAGADGYIDIFIPHPGVDINEFIDADRPPDCNCADCDLCTIVAVNKNGNIISYLCADCIAQRRASRRHGPR